jgi:uncharacterized protein
MRFEWEERKRESNLEKHGLDFLDAELIFRGALYSYPSERQSEARWTTVGLLEGRGSRAGVDRARRRDPAHFLSEGAA